VWAWHKRATERGDIPTVPAIVVAETWRGGRSRLREVLAACEVEHMDERLARIAGEALGSLRLDNAIDAVVMASAAQRGDVVLTSDAGDLMRFAGYFRDIRVIDLARS